MYTRICDCACVQSLSVPSKTDQDSVRAIVNNPTVLMEISKACAGGFVIGDYRGQVLGRFLAHSFRQHILILLDQDRQREDRLDQGS